MGVYTYGVNDTKKQVVDFVPVCVHPDDVIGKPAHAIEAAIYFWSSYVNSHTAYRVAKAAAEMGVERVFYDTADDYDSIDGYEVVASLSNRPATPVGKRISADE